MKFIIVFACLLAVVFANENANVLRSDAEVNVDSFKYALQLDDGTNLQQQGDLKAEDTWEVKGQFGWVAPGGEQISLSYVADENGYQPDPNSPLLPTPHPIPEHIVKAIKYIEEHPSKDQ